MEKQQIISVAPAQDFAYRFGGASWMLKDTGFYAYNQDDEYAWGETEDEAYKNFLKM